MKKVIAITGPSGAGKTSLSNYLREEYNYSFPRHTTTRKPRIDDEIGFYNYISEQEFLNKVNNDEFLFYSGYKGRYYGILKSDFIFMYEENEGLIINVNYMDLEQLLSIKDKYNMIIIQLTFKNIEEMILKRTSDRCQTIEDTKFRIEVATKNELAYADIINSAVDIVCYTDDMDFETEKQYINKKIGEAYDS